MLNLYYVVAYSSKLNEYARYVLTANSEHAAVEIIREASYDNSIIERSQFLAFTDTEVFTEL